MPESIDDKSPFLARYKLVNIERSFQSHYLLSLATFDGVVYTDGSFLVLAEFLLR